MVNCTKTLFKGVGFMKTISKCLSVLLTAIMLLSVMCVSPINVFAATTVSVGSASQLTDVCADINANGGEYVINLTDDISDASLDISKNGAKVTVVGNGHTITGVHGTAFVSGGATLNLGDGKSSLTLKCLESSDDPGVISVLPDGVCNMYGKVSVKDHKGSNYYGGGVTIQSGTFNMYGGTIDNCGIYDGSVCYGGGVAVISGGIFNMEGGTISNCYATSDYIDDSDPNRCFTAMGGGVFVTGGSSFTMDGGTITGCEATNFGGGVAMDISYGELSNFRWGNPKNTVTINDGTISANKADCGAGVFASGYFYSYAGAIGTYNPGIGTTNNPGLYIKGGEISSNIASDGGGGVYLAILSSAVKVQIHNALIKNNKADNGAGIENYGNWTQLSVDGCKITGNTATTNGGGILASSNVSGGYTTIKDTEISGNNSGDRGAGVYYDASSIINVSGADIIQNNKFNGTINNLNVLSKAKPVYVTGDLTGSQIGLSDPTLWDDGKDDTASDAVSTDYLTSGYKSNNTVIPAYAFTSDHKSWYVDYSDVNTNEIRLVRYDKDVNYHINNADMDSSIYENEIFTPYVTNHTVEVGNTIEEFHNIPKLKDPDGYVFKGWYYDRDSDSRPVEFGKEYETGEQYEKYKDIYAHWEKVDKIEQEKDIDEKNLPDTMKKDDGKYYYSSFGLFGIQIRPEKLVDENIFKSRPGGLRFVTSISEKLLSDVDALSDKKVESEDGFEHKVEYGFVTAPKDVADTVANDSSFNIDKSTYKLQYKGTDVNGVNTTVRERSENNFNYVTNVDCTSQSGGYGGNPDIIMDHRNCNKYRLATFVVTYDDDETDANKDKKVVARSYMRYYDANGLLRTFYNDYVGTCVYGGCSVSYNDAEEMSATNEDTKQ